MSKKLYFKLLFPYLKTIPRKCFCQTVSCCVVKDMFSQNTKFLLLNIAFYIKHGGLRKSFSFFLSTYKWFSSGRESCLTEVAEVTITKLGSTSSYNDWIIKFTELWTKAKTEFLTPQISAIPRQNTTSFKRLLTIVFLSWKSHYWDSFFYSKTWIMPGHEP